MIPHNGDEPPKEMTWLPVSTQPYFYWMKEFKWPKLGWNTSLNYTGCPRRNVKYFGRVFLMLNYTDITQNTYIQSW